MNDDEKVRKVEEMTGIDIAGFVETIRTMDPYGSNDGHCMFCKEPEPLHREGCKWIMIGGDR
jgi:hypothetical protein